MGGERSDPIRRISMEQSLWGRGPGSGRDAGRRGDFMDLMSSVVVVVFFFKCRALQVSGTGS